MIFLYNIQHSRNEEMGGGGVVTPAKNTTTPDGQPIFPDFGGSKTKINIYKEDKLTGIHQGLHKIHAQSCSLPYR